MCACGINKVMFVRAQTSVLAIANLPTDYRDAMVTYIASLSLAPETIYSYISCDACGKQCRSVSGEFYLCISCRNDCTKITNTQIPKPIIKPIQSLITNAKYALAILLTARFTVTVGVFPGVVMDRCNICIHTLPDHIYVFLRDNKIITTVPVCEGCFAEAKSCANIICNMIPLVRHVLKPLDDSASLISTYVWLGPIA